MAILPNELLGTILSLSLEEPSSRARHACSLVCHGWEWPAQRRIFEKIHIRGERSASQFADNALWFYGHPRLATYVKELTFSGLTDWRRDGTGMGGEAELRGHVVAGYVAVLHNLEVLIIRHCKWVGRHNLPFVVRPSLQRVEVSEVECLAWDGNVLDVLSFGTTLAEIRLSHIIWQHDNPRDEFMRPLTAEMLVIEQDSLHPNARAWQHVLPGVSGLGRIYFDNYGSDQAQLLRRLITENLHSLSELDLLVQQSYQGEGM